jgi:hypothetical protein
MKRFAWVAILVALSGCSVINYLFGTSNPGRTVRATLTTSDGARILLWRWVAKERNAPPVLVLPELGFDHRLVAPLCGKLRDAGFDVAALDGRDVTGAGGRFEGFAGWTIDVARAAAVMGPRTVIIGVGIGGEAAITVATVGTTRGLLLINVPLRHEVGNEALRLALKADGYDPKAWLEHGIGAILVATGRTTQDPTITHLMELVDNTSHAAATELATRLGDGASEALPRLPVRALVSVRDNLVPSEDALPNAGAGITHARRLGLLEGFKADYGHLDWLADDRELADVLPAIVEDLESIP